jgi:hypothetical protein
MMVPGKQKIYGVKTPVLNELARNIKKVLLTWRKSFGVRVHLRKR